LPELNALSKLPANLQKQQFAELCQGYWAETVELLNQANAVQQKRLAG
jgi:hypothetical protein